MMKAAIYERYGSPDVVRIEERPIPSPGPGEFLLKVYATTVNRTDTGFRSAAYFVSRFFTGLLKPKQQILGTEFAGEVVEVGNGTADVRVGDRLFGFNDTHFGANAEYMIVKGADAYATIPEGMAYTKAAALAEGSHYALSDLRPADVGHGTRLLVYGATGAVGSAAVQLALDMGADVSAVCGPGHEDVVRGFGVESVVDYTSTAFAALEGPFDVIFDAVGKQRWSWAKPLLAPKGIYMSTELGPWGQNPLLALTTPMFGGKRVLFPIPVTTKEDMVTVRDLAAAGRFTPLIDRVVAFDEIPEMHRYAESGQKAGNIIVDVTRHSR